MSINHYSMKAFLHFLYTTAWNFNGQGSILRKLLLFGRNFVCITLLILPQIMNPLTLISIQRKSWDNTIIISGRGRSPNVSNCNGIDITLGASQMVLVVKNLTDNAGDTRGVVLIPKSGKSPGGRHGNPLQYSWLENPMGQEPGGLQSTGSQSWTRLKWLSTHAQT